MTWFENALERPSFAKITAELSKGITTTHKHAYICMYTWYSSKATSHSLSIFSQVKSFPRSSHEPLVHSE